MPIMKKVDSVALVRWFAVQVSYEPTNSSARIHMIDFKGHRFEQDIILTGVRGYLAYPLSYRNLEEMLAERGVEVDHSSVYRWVQKFSP